MLEKTMFNRLRAVLLLATELPEIIMSHPDAPRPETDYGALTLISSNTTNMGESVILEANPNYVSADRTTNTGAEPEPFFEVIEQEWEWVWQFDVYSDRAMDVARRVIPWERSATGQAAFSPMTIDPIPVITRLPELINNQWQDRVTTNITARAYVCEGTELDGADVILVGRVPVDIIEETTMTLTNDGNAIEPLTIINN